MFISNLEWEYLSERGSWQGTQVAEHQPSPIFIFQGDLILEIEGLSNILAIVLYTLFVKFFDAKTI